MESASRPRRLERPHDYRTPSPPPYSPILTPASSPPLDGTDITRPEWTSTSRPSKHSSLNGGSGNNHDYTSSPQQISYGRSGHRSARSMDAFASIALATQYTSPPSVIGKRAFNDFHASDRSKKTRYNHVQQDHQLFDDEMPRRASSPPTQVEEAQLLLDFAVEARAREIILGRQQPQTLTSSIYPNASTVSSHGNVAIAESYRQDRKLAGTTPQQQEDQVANGDKDEATSPTELSIQFQQSVPRPPPASGKTATGSPIFTADTASPSMQWASKEVAEQQPLTNKSLKTRSSSEPHLVLQDVHTRTLRSVSERPANHDVGETPDMNFPEDTQLSRLSDDRIKQRGSPTFGLGSVEQSSALTNQSAVCAACSFAKNSLDSENDHGATSWINCDGCKSWFHFACAGFKTEREVRAVDKFRCKKCKPIHGSTSYVRKSSRAHASIDYAGLHQGVVKSSDDRPEHHYISPIKSGATSFQPETFPRMSPELVTAEYFEKGGGMKEPVIIPASLNARPGSANDAGLTTSEHDHSPRQPGIDQSANLEEWLNDDVASRVVPDDNQDGLDMVMPEGLTVRRVAELYGMDEKIEVIDVKSQNGESRKWTMKRWADYYESTTEAKVIRNVISLEVSRSRLGRLIRRPQVVRDLDLQDSVWPEELINKGEFPNVQFYCLMSVADCFTDFHIDFGGSSVFYHILKGKKTFLFIPPKEKHLKKYEEWCKSPAQNWTFLPDQTRECYRVDLTEGDTMLIPSGWIHAVWTPEDSLVIGGNFLTRMSYGMQFRVHQIEKATGVARKFRYPHFQKLHWFTVFQYLEKDPLPSSVRNHLEGGFCFDRKVPTAQEFNEWGENSNPSPENYHSRYYSQPELDGLPELLRYILRTVLIDNGTIVDGISADVRNAVKRSIPRTHGDPSEVIKTFAIWCAWKRGNEPIPHWAYPQTPISGTASDKVSATVSRKLAEEAASKAPRRQSQRMQAQKEAANSIFTADGDLPMEESFLIESSTSATKRTAEQVEGPSAINNHAPAPKRARLSSGSSGNQRKTACDSCRRRRRACKHKETVDSTFPDVATEVAPSNLVHKEALLNGNALQEKLSALGGLFNSLKSDVVQSAAIIGMPGQDPLAPDHTRDSTSATALTAKAASLPPFNDDANGDASLASDAGIGSRPRTKACNHCRKSKRRCIHDAFGNEDPVKVAESAVPRPHARKVHKGENTSRNQDFSPESDYQYPPVLQQDVSIREDVADSSGLAPVVNMMRVAASTDNHDSARMADDSASLDHLLTHTDQMNVSSRAPISHDKLQTLPNGTGVLDARQRITGNSAAFDDNIELAKTDPLGARPGFRRSEQGVVSPPASSDGAIVDTFPEDDEMFLHFQSTSQEASPSQKKPLSIFTPESGPTRKPDRRPSYVKPPDTDVLGSKKWRSTSVPEADEESLRLIKELQAQDLGLRRRGKA